MIVVFTVSEELPWSISKEEYEELKLTVDTIDKWLKENIEKYNYSWYNREVLLGKPIYLFINDSVDAVAFKLKFGNMDSFILSP